MSKIVKTKAFVRNFPALFAALAAVSLLSSCFVLPEEERVLGPPVMKPPEVEYSTVAAERKDISRQVYLYGHLVPVVDQELFFRYQGGRLTNVYVKLGQQVKKGQLLAELDLGNLFNQLEQREISLDKAKIRYEMSKAFNTNKFDLQLAELDIQLAELQLEDTQARTAPSLISTAKRGNSCPPSSPSSGSSIQKISSWNASPARIPTSSIRGWWWRSSSKGKPYWAISSGAPETRSSPTTPSARLRRRTPFS
jgi:multidrug efflux pump subunit AcrA (membrane-fusion protein)